MTPCPKCGYERQPTDTAPDYECPKCKIIYSKFDSAAEKKRQDLLELQRQKANKNPLKSEIIPSFFNKIFRKTETKPQLAEQSVQRPDILTEVEIKTQEVVTPAALMEEIQKAYDIGEIKKQSTQIKNKDGFLASVNFVKNFIAANHIEFAELISLLKKIIPYMKKEKNITDVDILTYVNTQIDKFSEKDNIENLTTIADILSRVSNSNGLEYLEAKLGDYKTDKDKNFSYFSSIILLSDYYLAAKKSDEAFQAIGRASLLVTNLADKFDYLSKQIIIFDKSAHICFYGQKTPRYADYIVYVIPAFILEICRDAIAFPLLSSFYYRKNICFNEGCGGWGLENENFYKALDDLEITKHKKELSSVPTFC